MVLLTEEGGLAMTEHLWLQVVADVEFQFFWAGASQ